MFLGIIGAGSIGRFLIEQVNEGSAAQGARFTTLLDERPLEGDNSSLSRIKTWPENVTIARDFEQFVQSGIDVCVESANVATAKVYTTKLLQSGISVILCSVGCLADRRFYDSVLTACQAGRSHLYVPSGAIAGLDAVQAAASIGALKDVTIVTRKPPIALGVTDASEEEVLFEGSAEEAIKGFPKNVNSSVALSCAGLGAEKTTVRIIMDPTVQRNEHTISATGSFGDLEVRVKNAPMPSNPKTSFLAAMSVLALIQKVTSPIQIGT